MEAKLSGEMNAEKIYNGTCYTSISKTRTKALNAPAKRDRGREGERERMNRKGKTEKLMVARMGKIQQNAEGVGDAKGSAFLVTVPLGTIHSGILLLNKLQNLVLLFC